MRVPSGSPEGSFLPLGQLGLPKMAEDNGAPPLWCMKYRKSSSVSITSAAMRSMSASVASGRSLRSSLVTMWRT